MELFRTIRKGVESGNWKYYDSKLGKNIDLGTDDIELAKAKYPDATIDKSKSLPTFASVLAPTPVIIPLPVTTASPMPPKTPSGEMPTKPISGDLRPKGVDYTPSQIARIRETYVNMIAEADCDMLRLMFSMFGYSTPEIRPEDVASIKLGWEMLAMEWFINGVPPAWLVLTLTHTKLISRMAINAKPKQLPKQEEKAQ